MEAEVARKKISVIGAGNVGATAAFLIAQKQLGDVVMIDIVDGIPQGKALDMAQMGPVEMFDAAIDGDLDYTATAGSDLVIITSGSPRKPGMTREDLLQTNANIVGSVTENVVKQSPDCIIMMLTNPLDIMTYHAWKVSGFPSHRVVGQAGVLDSARFRYFISLELGVSMEDIHALVLGGHGDTMVPLPRYTTVNGIPIPQLIPEDRIESMAQRTRDGGAEIVNLLKTSGYYAAGASLAQMAEAIILDKKRLLPCSAHLTGQYGIDDLYIGVPIKLGGNGVEEILEIELTDDELGSLQHSAATYREGIELLGY
ncbi:malate dehydrogenase [Candidatus Poribacteria bacterium]|nr:malate dehydrogenase [Candidatus Poribacteria bacterium]